MKIQFITSLIYDFIEISFTKCSLFKQKLNLFVKFWFFFCMNSAILFPRQTTCSKYSVGIALGKCPFDDISSLCHWPRNRAIWNSTKIWTTYHSYDRNQLAARKVGLCLEKRILNLFHLLFFVQIVFFLFSLLENHFLDDFQKNWKIKWYKCYNNDANKQKETKKIEYPFNLNVNLDVKIVILDSF